MGNVPPEMGGILGNVCIYVECYWFLPRFYSGHKKRIYNPCLQLASLLWLSSD